MASRCYPKFIYIQTSNRNPCLSLYKSNSMVILKIGTGADKERDVEIVNEKGIWESGNYPIFSSAFLHDTGNNPPEPHNVNSPNFLGEMIIEKEKNTWAYKGDKLDKEEQQQVAKFIIDYSAPDGVY